MAKSLRLRRKRSSLKKRRAQGKKSKVARMRRSKRRLIQGGNEENKQSGKNILLIIDPQNDFIPDPIKKPSLPVPNAKNDMDILVQFLSSTTTIFDEIHVSLDTHNLTHIAHVDFWDLNDDQKNSIRMGGDVFIFKILKGDKIALFQPGSEGQILEGCENIQPRGFITIDGEEVAVEVEVLKALAIEYITKLTEKNNKNLTIPLPNTWPTHCIRGSKGWEIYESLAQTLESIVYKGKVFIHEKGTNDLVEMYSIFKAEVPYNALTNANQITEYTEIVPEPNNDINKPNEIRNYATTLNNEFIKQLRGENNINTVYVCGEAKTHCVKTSAEDLVGNDGKNVIMLYNVMSDILFPHFINARKEAFQELKNKGVKFATIEGSTIKMNDDYDPATDN